MPFDRESPSMKDVRWLAILENRVLVFGVPWMVAKALDRYERHEPADPILLQRARASAFGCQFLEHRGHASADTNQASAPREHPRFS